LSRSPVASATALLTGGTAPAVNGDDDETKLSAANGAVVRDPSGRQHQQLDAVTRILPRDSSHWLSSGSGPC
jgi:hypothetical protein